MLRRASLALAALLVLGVLAVAIGLGLAHQGIRREGGPLPTLDELLPAADAASLPVALHWVNTASQSMPRSQVLDPDRDPYPSIPYVMSHPSFVLEWADGRILLVDVGMTRDQALEFGRPVEWVGGAPMEAHRSVREALGERAARVEGVVFTHLHLDHVGALPSLCEGRTRPLPLFWTEAQSARPNYTTRPGLERIGEASCVEPTPLAPARAAAVPGFPGVSVIGSAGHTPGSQLVIATVTGPAGPSRFAITGDSVNHRDGVRHDVPKPFLYRLLVVPESEARQAEVRAFLQRLHREAGFTLLVNHDRGHLEATGLPSF